MTPATLSDSTTSTTDISTDVATATIQTAAPLPLDTLAQLINQHHYEARDAWGQGLAHALIVGDALIRVKQRLAHGKFLPWIKRHCDFSIRLAQAYMRVVKRLPSKTNPNVPRVEHFDDLSLRRALALVVVKKRSAAPVVSDGPQIECRCPACGHEWTGSPKLPTADEAHALRWILKEMESIEFVARTLHEIPVGRGGSYEVIGGAAGAPVYGDIVDGYASPPTRAQVIRAVRRALVGDWRAVLAQRALKVARGRIAGDSRLSRPSLPPDAGDLPQSGQMTSADLADFERHVDWLASA